MKYYYNSPFTKFDFFPFFQSDKLPSHKRVIEGIDIGRDERAPPVNLQQTIVFMHRFLPIRRWAGPSLSLLAATL